MRRNGDRERQKKFHNSLAMLFGVVSCRADFGEHSWVPAGRLNCDAPPKPRGAVSAPPKPVLQLCIVLEDYCWLKLFNPES